MRFTGGPRKGSDDAIEAKAKLKIVLDGWTLGEEPADVERSHPELKISVVGMGLYKILKYEIVTEGKKGPFGYEFAVIIIYQSEAGTEIKKNERFDVQKDGGKWYVNAFTVAR